jgi:CRP/FNR family cyclic AMP-dependent transcriptional regulator
MSEKLWYLKQCELFVRLAPEDLAWLEARSRARTFAKRSPIYLPADAADSVLLLASGRVKICNITSEGKQAILAFIEPGELFGELAVFDEGARDEYAEAVEKSAIVLIPGEHFRELMERHAGVSVGVTKLIGLRRRRIERRLKYLLFRSNRERLVHLLLELTETYGRKTNDGLLLDIKLSHQDLANVIGSTRETVTVTLGELQAEGRLVLGRRKIVLTDLEQLAQSVDATPPVVPHQRPQTAGSRV